MEEFWAMTDIEKVILVLKVLLVAWAWGSLIFCALLVTVLSVEYIKGWVRDWREDHAKKKQREIAREQLSLYTQVPYSVGIAPARPHWADQKTDVFTIAEEISK